MKPAATYSTAQVSRITGATLRSLQYWDERGILSPRFDSNGERAYSSGELVLAQIVTALRKKGMSLQQVTVLMQTIRQWPIKTSAQQRYVVTDAKDIWLTRSANDAAIVASQINGSVIVARIGEPQ